MSRELSGVYFRYNKDNICFEELPEEEQDRIIDSYTNEQKKRLIKILATSLLSASEELDFIFQELKKAAVLIEDLEKFD